MTRDEIEELIQRLHNEIDLLQTHLITKDTNIIEREAIRARGAIMRVKLISLNNRLANGDYDDGE